MLGGFRGVCVCVCVCVILHTCASSTTRPPPRPPRSLCKDRHYVRPRGTARAATEPGIEGAAVARGARANPRRTLLLRSQDAELRGSLSSCALVGNSSLWEKSSLARGRSRVPYGRPGQTRPLSRPASNGGLYRGEGFSISLMIGQSLI